MLPMVKSKMLPRSPPSSKMLPCVEEAWRLAKMLPRLSPASLNVSPPIARRPLALADSPADRPSNPAAVWPTCPPAGARPPDDLAHRRADPSFDRPTYRPTPWQPQQTTRLANRPAVESSDHAAVFPTGK